MSLDITRLKMMHILQIPQSFFGGGSIFAQNYSGTSEAEALFGQITWAIAEKWDLTIGARKTEEDKTGFKEYVGIFSQSDKAVLMILAEPLFFPMITVKTLIYTLKLADGFKAGGINAEAPTPFEALKPYAPETVESTEFGLKGIVF